MLFEAASRSLRSFGRIRDAAKKSTFRTGSNNFLNFTFYLILTVDGKTPDEVVAVPEVVVGVVGAADIGSESRS